MEFQLSLESESLGSAHPDAPLAAMPSTPVSVAIGLLAAQRSGSVLVCEPRSGDGVEQLVGIFTERDALRLMADAADGLDNALLEKSVGEVMSPQVVRATEANSVGQAIRMMHSGGYRHLPIVDASGALTGSVSVHGIVHYLVQHFPETIYNLPPKNGGAAAEREGA